MLPEPLLKADIEIDGGQAVTVVTLEKGAATGWGLDGLFIVSKVIDEKPCAAITQVVNGGQASLPWDHPKLQALHQG